MRDRLPASTRQRRRHTPTRRRETTQAEQDRERHTPAAPATDSPDQPTQPPLSHTPQTTTRHYARHDNRKQPLSATNNPQPAQKPQ